MENLHRKTVAVGAVLALCLTAFAGMTVIGDECDAEVGLYDYRSVPALYSHSLFNGTFLITKSVYFDLEDVYDDTPEGVINNYVVDPLDSGSFGLVYDSSHGTIKGYPNKIGQFSIRMYHYSEPEGEDYAYTAYFRVVESDHSHSVSYSPNGGTGSMNNTVVTDSNTGSSNVTLAANTFTKAGYDFAGWKIGNVIYQPGQTVSVAADTTVNVIAQWTPIPVNITSSDADADIVVGNSFSRTITTDVAGATLSFTGPGWLTLSGSTLVGTPSVAGDYTVTVTAVYTASSDSQTFTIHVVNRLAFESVPTGGILATPVI